ncbi:MAG: universal stress protein [Dethiobacter sp.]|jgi:nucleotide-binding universal stress UspA family protein|nr:universal stress protein [Dethiobacter sp.]
MFEKVMVATDFSACAEQLWDCLGEFSSLGTKEIVLMHAVPLTPPARFVDQARVRLEERKLEVESQGFTAKIVVQVGQAPQEINSVAVKEQVDLVLVGAKGENRIREVFLGNTVRDLIRTSKKPVLIEKFKNARGKWMPVCSRKFERVLLPTDFSEASMRVFSLVKDRLAPKIAEAILIHVVDSGHTEDLLEVRRAEAGDRLNAMRQNLEDAGVKSSICIRVGIPSEHIIKTAREEAVTSVMIATRGAGSIKELLLGSTAENVVRRCTRPILLFPGKNL